MSATLQSYVGGEWRTGVRTGQDISPANPGEVVYVAVEGGEDEAAKQMGEAGEASEPAAEDFGSLA